jgi:hypothetical protein
MADSIKILMKKKKSADDAPKVKTIYTIKLDPDQMEKL